MHERLERLTLLGIELHACGKAFDDAARSDRRELAAIPVRTHTLNEVRRISEANMHGPARNRSKRLKGSSPMKAGTYVGPVIKVVMATLVDLTHADASIAHVDACRGTKGHPVASDWSAGPCQSTHGSNLTGQRRANRSA